MAHELDMTNGRANIAYLGNRNDVWHRLGTEMSAGMSIDQWAQAAGLAWTAHKLPAMADLQSIGQNVINPVEGSYFIHRGDNGANISQGRTVTDGYSLVQPRDVLSWFDRYISVDDRFQLDVAGSLKGGSTIWATALYRDPLNVAGDKHIARILMSTTFDGSGSTINQGSMTRVVCNNTMRVAHAEKRAVIRTRHSTRFDAAAVGRELAEIAKGFAVYKAIGDSMAQAEMTRDQVAAFFKDCLDIKHDASRDDISTRKLNQLVDLGNAYADTVKEGTDAGTVWTALNAITRFVDHDRSVRGNGISAEEKQFTSAQFGSGDALKGKAMALLLPRIRDKVLVTVS